MNLIIYHADCPDGFCAAYIAKKRYPEAVLLPRSYGQPLPLAEVHGKEVLVVDFSWRTLEDVMALHNVAAEFKIFDHHKTVFETLNALPFATFDMQRSGAGITWDMLFGGFVRPWWVNYVEDRDLWRWTLPDSAAVAAYIMSLPQTVEAWTELEKTSLETVIEKGRTILLYINHYIEKCVAQRQMGTIGGFSVAVVNAQYMNISDVGERLCDFADIGMGWFERGDGIVQASLRSRGDIDVSVIAKKFGGGGHRNAAGFQVSKVEGRGIVDHILTRGVFDATTE